MTTEAAHRPAGRAALRDLEFVLAADLAPDARRVVYTTRRTSAADDTISAWVVAVGDPAGRWELPVDGDPALLLLPGCCGLSQRVVAEPGRSALAPSVRRTGRCFLCGFFGFHFLCLFSDPVCQR